MESSWNNSNTGMCLETQWARKRPPCSCTTHVWAEPEKVNCQGLFRAAAVSGLSPYLPYHTVSDDCRVAPEFNLLLPEVGRCYSRKQALEHISLLSFLSPPVCACTHVHVWMYIHEWMQANIHLMRGGLRTISGVVLKFHLEAGSLC